VKIEKVELLVKALSADKTARLPGVKDENAVFAVITT